MKKTQRAQFSSLAFSAIGVDEAAGILRGAIVASKGEAKGWGLFLGDKFLESVAKLRSLAVRVDPPGEDVHGGAQAIVGEATAFRRDGDDVRADIAFVDPNEPAAKKVLKLAARTPHLFGLSLDIVYQIIDAKRGDNLKEIDLREAKAVDFVSHPAATRALFAEPEVDTTNEGDMNYEFLRKQCAAFGISFPATDSAVTAELATQAQDALTAKFAELQTGATRLAALEKESNDLKAQLAARTPTPPAFDEEKFLDKVVAKLQTKGLAGIAGKPAPAGDPDDGKSKSVKLSQPVRDLAAKLKQKPEELQAKLAALSPAAQEVVLELGLDPDQFAADHAKLIKVTETMPL